MDANSGRDACAFYRRQQRERRLAGWRWERWSVGVLACWSADCRWEGWEEWDGLGQWQIANGRIGAFAFLVIANRFRPPRKALVRSGGKLGCGPCVLLRQP